MEINDIKNIDAKALDDILKVLVNEFPEAIGIIDKSGEYVFQNKAHRELLGYTDKELKGKTPELHCKQDFCIVMNSLEKNNLFCGEIKSITKQGKEIDVFLKAFSIQVQNQKYYVGIKENITALKEKEVFFNTILSNAPIGFAIYKEKFLYTNPYLLDLLGYSEQEIKQIYIIDFVEGEYKHYLEQELKRKLKGEYTEFQGVIPVRTKYGNIRWIYIKAQSIKYKSEPAGMLVAIDFTEKKELEDRLYFIENFDKTTGLPNKHLFIQELDLILKDAKKDNEEVAVIILDIHNFTELNDTFGTDIGDEILIQLSKRLKSCLFETDLVARHGSDEFILAIRKFKSQEKFSSFVLDKIKNCLNEPFEYKSQVIHLNYNIGVSFFPYDSQDPIELMKNAELALKDSKKREVNSIVFFNEDINEAFKKQISIISDLKRAIQFREFDVFFQPKIDLHTEEIIGAEALARWKLPPNEFIPLLVEANLMFDAGCQITEKTLKYARELIKIKPDLKISINMSFEQLKFDNCPDKLYGLTCQNEVDPQNIIVEITETETMRNPNVHINRLNLIKQNGYTISIDDFGTGYSSLNYLKLIPASEIKIDRSFIRDIFTDENDAELVKLIINIAKMLDMKVVAEGVETKQQAEILRILGCDYAQGYYYAKPMPFDDFMKYLKQQ